MTEHRKRLAELSDALPEEQARLLLDFAEFLHQRYAAPTAVPSVPLAIPRPEAETVVAALKRLSATYPMLDKSKVLHESSDLVSQHLIGGRGATEVIDDLEAVFASHYRRWSATIGSSSSS